MSWPAKAGHPDEVGLNRRVDTRRLGGPVVKLVLGPALAGPGGRAMTFWVFSNGSCSSSLRMPRRFLDLRRHLAATGFHFAWNVLQSLRLIAARWRRRSRNLRGIRREL